MVSRVMLREVHGGINRLRVVAGVTAAGALLLTGCQQADEAATIDVAASTTADVASSTTMDVAASTTASVSASTPVPVEPVVTAPSSAPPRSAPSSGALPDTAVLDATPSSATGATPPAAERYPLGAVGDLDASSSRLNFFPIIQCRSDGGLRAPSAEETVVPYPALGQECLVGPPYANGTHFVDATVAQDPSSGWAVTINVAINGATAWMQLSEMCFAAGPTCPSSQVAIVFDGAVVTAPRVLVGGFAKHLYITGLSTKEEADEIANAVNEAT